MTRMGISSSGSRARRRDVSATLYHGDGDLEGRRTAGLSPLPHASTFAGSADSSIRSGVGW